MEKTIKLNIPDDDVIVKLSNILAKMKIDDKATIKFGDIEEQLNYTDLLFIVQDKLLSRANYELTCESTDLHMRKVQDHIDTRLKEK